MAFTPETRDKAAQTRQKNTEKRAAEKISAQGVGESKVFGGSPEAEDNPILNCHVGGVLVRDLALEMQGRILWQQTDEGIAAYNEGKSDVHVAVGAEGFDKALEQRRDDVKERDMDSYEARDPLKEVYDQHIQPGMRGKFLSSRKVKENGGAGDYEIVKDAKGEPVSVRGMILGQMPEKRAQARNRHYQERSNRLLSQMVEKYKSEGGKTAVVDQ